MLKTWKSLAARSITSSLLFGLVGCGQVDQAHETSETKVTNGLKASGEFPSVILLQFTTSRGTSICTGTFVNADQVVTAAHCVYDMAKERRSAAAMTFTRTLADGRSQRISARSLQYHPAYTVVAGQLSNHDIAVVTFPENSAPATTELYPTEPQVGQSFTIVGFGVNDYRQDSSGTQTGTGSGVKHKGENEIYRIDSGMILFYGVPTASDPSNSLGQDVASGSGDSGGPLLIDGRLAGVTSGGGLANGKDKDGNSITVKVSNYVDLNEPSNHDFLMTALH